MTKTLKKLLENRISPNPYGIVCLVVCAVTFLFWSFFCFRYAEPMIDIHIGSWQKIVIYFAVSLYIGAILFDSRCNVSGLISAVAVPAGFCMAILGFRRYPALMWAAIAVCTAIFALSVFALLYRNSSGSVRSRIFTALAAGKRAASLVLAVILVLIAIYITISLNVRAHIDQTVEPSNVISSEGNHEHAERLLTLDNGNWSKISKTERLAALQTAANYMCEELGIEPITVRVGAFEGHINDTRYYRNRNTVRISVVTLEYDDHESSLHAVAKGVYYAYIANCVEEFTKDPDSFNRADVSSFDVRLWADELGKTNNNFYWKYWQMNTDHSAVVYAQNVCRKLEYSSLMHAVKNGNAVLSRPMKINNSCVDSYFAIYKTHIEEYSMPDEGVAISCAVLDPVDEFEDTKKTLDSLYIDENLTNKESPNAMDDVIQFTDRDTIYRYAVDAKTSDYVLVGKGKTASYYPHRVNWDNNPIDNFFEKYVLDESTSSNIDMTRYEMVRRDLWLIELKNAYRLMKESINPTLSAENRKQYSDAVDDSLKDFLAYVENGAYIEALTGATSVFTLEDESISAGTALSGYHTRLEGDMYRAEALRIYSSVEYIYDFKDSTDAFAFSESDFLPTVTENYEIVLAERYQ